MDLKRLPFLPSWRTMHLMAKAAVAVYETVVVRKLITTGTSR
jgi:hypothetical protein